jgi:hypothetical protein
VPGEVERSIFDDHATVGVFNQVSNQFKHTDYGNLSNG